ncbi:MAG: hypothetical protein V3R54_03100 [Thermodesulfovibrionia bacterium]
MLKDIYENKTKQIQKGYCGTHTLQCLVIQFYSVFLSTFGQSTKAKTQRAIMFKNGINDSNENQPEKPALFKILATNQTGKIIITTTMIRINRNSVGPIPNIFYLSVLFFKTGQSPKANISITMRGPSTGIKMNKTIAALKPVLLSIRQVG